MPTFSIPGPTGSLYVVDLREESPTPSGALPIVFVHGMVGHTGFWNAALAACADRRRAVAFDLRGHGNSAPPADGDYSIEACAADTLAVVDALGLGPIVLVGHSFGALVTIEAAATRPDSVRRLVLVDPPGDFTALPDPSLKEQMASFLATVASADWRSAVERAFEQALDGSTASTASSVRARLASTPHATALSMYRSMLAYRARRALERYLATPDTSAHAILAPANAWPFSLHALVPALAATVMPDVGHWLMLDAPNRFALALDAAIEGT